MQKKYESSVLHGVFKQNFVKEALNGLSLTHSRQDAMELLMDSLKPCPSCRHEVEIIDVPRIVDSEKKKYFFVNCESCGFGTKEAYPSVHLLVEKWNELLTQEREQFA